MKYIKGKVFTGGHYEVSKENELFLSTIENKIKRLMKADKAGNELEALNFVRSEDIWGWNLTSEYLLTFSRNDNRTVIYTLENFIEVFKYDQCIFPTRLFENDIYIYIYMMIFYTVLTKWLK